MTIDFKEILDQAKTKIKEQYGEKQVNDFNITQQVRNKANATKINNMDDLDAWWKFLKQEDILAFYFIFGTKPLNSKCAPAGSTDHVIYNGTVPATVEEAQKLYKLVWELNGSRYESYKLTISNLIESYETVDTIEIAKGIYDPFDGGKWEYSVLTAGHIVKERAEGHVV